MSSYPDLIINSYVWEQFRLAKSSIYSNYSSRPFVPIRDINSDYPWGDSPYIVYDSFMRPRSKNKYFYPIKTAQMMYSIKGSVSDIYEWRDFISNVLDREDDAAKDINEYAGNSGNFDPLTVKFHCINTSQVNYVGNTTEQSGQRRHYSANLIVKYDYHITDIYNA